jgi:hypothetical protein
LSTDTGYDRDYAKDPYSGYYRVRSIMFPVGKVRRDLSPKDRIVGLEVNGEAKAYPLSRLQPRKGMTRDLVGNMIVLIEVNSEGEVVGITDGRGEKIPHTFSYWFAWQTFHPETTVYQGDGQSE